ncbi:MAG: protein kinase [Gemmatimonadales bacterium]
MNTDMWARWGDVVVIVDRALDHEPAARPRFVEQACSGDAVLRGEVERLLDAAARAGDFLDRPAAAEAAPLVSWLARHESQGLAMGTRFGVYEVTGLLGRGGMATVYLAEDHKHRRTVAVKVFDAEVGAAVGREWFLREIETAARLHHPHILPLHDSGESGGRLYYVMPHVEGESLRQRLAREGRIPLAGARRIALEVAGALDYAHRQGVVHRDIKPENILLQDGQAVVADFGIARAIATGVASLCAPGTLPAVGTPAYMSPEQATRGAVVDGRTDVYALACVVYELLAGQPPFAGASVEQILAGHAAGPVPPLPGLGEAVPPSVAQAVARALAKRPDDRFASAAEFGAALAGPEPDPAAAVASGPGRGTKRTPARRWAFGAGALAVAAAGLILLVLPRPAQLRPGLRIPLTVDAGLEIDPAISPDGRRLAYTAGSPVGLAIYVRPLDRRAPRPLAPGIAHPQRFPIWSPDGSRILFRSPRGIEVIPALGGEVKVLVEAPRNAQGGLGESGPALMPGPWSPDSRRFTYVRSDSLFVAGSDGGPARLLAHGGEPHSPAWSPDGRWIAFVTGNRQSLETGFTFGNVGKSAIWLVRASGGDPVLLVNDRSSRTSPVWLPGGRAMLFVSDRDGGRDIYQAAVGRAGEPSSAPVRITTGLNPLAISLSADGRRLVYALFTESSNVWSLPIPSRAPVSVSEARPVTAGSQVIEGFDVSPDGRWLAFDSDRSGNPDIYRVAVGGGDAQQLTTDRGANFGPLWSPDGRELAFHALRGGLRQVFVMAADGKQQVRVTEGREDERSPSWLRGGRSLLFVRNLGRDDKELRVVSSDGKGGWRAPRTILRGNVLHAAVSPDGRQVAFTSDRGLTVAGAAGDSSRILVPVIDGGNGQRPSYLAWSSDGREIYYLALDPAERATIWSIRRQGGTPRLLVRFDDPTKPWHRYGFRARGGRFYLTLGDRQSDIWELDLTQKR